MTDAMLDRRRDARRRFAVLCLWLPLSVFAALSIAQLALLPTLPDTVAIHWNLTGDPDGFAPAWVYPVMTMAIGGGVTVLLAGLALLEMKSPNQSTQYRFLGTVVGGETGLISVVMLGLLVGQSGVDDPADAMNSWWILAFGALAAAVMGLVYFFLIEDPPAPEAVRAEPLPAAPSGLTVWHRSVSISRGGGIALGALLGGSTLLMIVLCLVALRDGARVPVAAWVALVVVVVVTIIALGMVRFEVRVDDTGLTARAPLGWPVSHTATEQITSADVVRVSPLGEFGGWGWRYGGDGMGIVLRAGEGIRVGRRGKSNLTITVDDAETAVAVLRRQIAADGGPRGGRIEA